MDKLAWICLFLAGAFEISFAICLKYAQLYPWRGLIVLSVLLGAISVSLLYYAVSRNIPMGTAYVVWTGIGAVGVASLGILLFDEPRNLWRFVCMGIIVLGIIGLEFQGT